MKTIRILFWLILYSSVSLLCADRVDTLNELFTYPCWHDMPNLDHIYIRIVDRWMETTENFFVNDLIGSSFYSPIVDEENAECSTRQAHQFLNCKYALELKKCYNLVAELGVQCQIKEFKLSDLQECLNRLVWTVKECDEIALRMHGALSFFYQLSPSTVFNKDVSDILDAFLAYSETKLIDEYNFNTTKETIDIELLAIDKEISKILHRLGTFYNVFCYPIPFEKCNFESLFNRESLKNLLTYFIDMNELTFKVMDFVRGIKIEFINSYENESGFCFEPISKTSRTIMNDSETVRRVVRMNCLLENRGWLMINELEIKMYREENKTVFDLVEPFTKSNTVTNKNVDVKIQMTHLFLNCKYTRVLKEYFDYVILIWNTYFIQKMDDFGSVDSLDICLVRFRTTILKSVPFLSLMRDALSFFYELTPEMKYNKEIFNIIESFKTAFVDENVTLDVEKNIPELLQRLGAFSNQFCWTDDLFKVNFDLESSEQHTMDNTVEQLFINKINDLINTAYAQFGFNTV